MRAKSPVIIRNGKKMNIRLNTVLSMITGMALGVNIFYFIEAMGPIVGTIVCFGGALCSGVIWGLLGNKYNF